MDLHCYQSTYFLEMGQGLFLQRPVAGIPVRAQLGEGPQSEGVQKGVNKGLGWGKVPPQSLHLATTPILKFG